jgi:hypothetical protein
VFSGDRMLAVFEACVELVQLRLALGLAHDHGDGRPKSSPPYTIVCGIDRTASSAASGRSMWTCSTAA